MGPGQKVWRVTLGNVTHMSTKALGSQGLCRLGAQVNPIGKLLGKPT